MPAPLSLTVTVSCSGARAARTSMIPPSAPPFAAFRKAVLPNPCSRAFCSSSVSTIASGVATADGSIPNCPMILGVTRASGEATSPAIIATRSAISSKSTISSGACDRVSCTIAIDPTRRTASSSAARASGAFIRLACSRSSAATVCRLFLTRWWISRMVASLVSSSRSRRRNSVTSRTRISAPVRWPPTMSGIERSWTTAPWPSISVSLGARPRATSISDSSTGSPFLLALVSDALAAPSSAPSKSAVKPSLRYADCAFGLA